MVVADGQGVPLGVQLASASPHECTLIESTLEQVAVPRAGRGRPRKNPERLIYDRAADSDALRARLKTITLAEHVTNEIIAEFRDYADLCGDTTFSPAAATLTPSRAGQR